jgi:3-oxoadipate enol-lactonase
VTIGNCGIHYQLRGPDGAPVLVLNNGILMNAAASWVRQADAFAAHYRLLLYDCRGQGESDHPDAEYTMEQHADDLAGLLDALAVDKAHVAGISYGGEVAQAFAIRHPARVRSLLLADTVSEVGPELRLVVSSWRAAAADGDAGRLFDLSVPWNFSAAFVTANPALLAEARRRYEQLDLPAVARLCDAFLRLDLTGALSKVRVAACILHGDLDRLKGEPYARILHRALPHAERHVIHGAGHASCWERPEEFNTVVLGFLAKQGP